jgi:hypothetical protein
VNWTITARVTRRITEAEMKNKKKTAGYNWTDKHRECEDINCKPHSGHNTGLQKKWHTCKQNASYQITQNKKKLHNKWQKEPGKTYEETYGCVRLKWFNKT